MLVDITEEGDGFWDNDVWVTLNSVSLGSKIYRNEIVVTQIELANAAPKTTKTTKITNG